MERQSFFSSLFFFSVFTLASSLTRQFIGKDGSGKIDPQELLLVMKSLGQAPTEAEVADMIHDVDANGDGEIDFNEFVTMMSKKLNEASGADHEDDEMRAAFRVFDKDGDGFIDASELKLVMQQVKSASLSFFSFCPLLLTMGGGFQCDSSVSR